jgi:hypothetical protein
MDTEKDITVFLSEFEFQVDLIQTIYECLSDKLVVFEKETPSREMIDSAGYWMHNLYCAFEDLFKQVSSFWENNLSADGDYHVNLLKRMMVNIKDIRPPLLFLDSYEYLNELRGFRHVFRHAYSYGLDDERVAYLIRKTISKKEMVLADLSKFREKIEELGK